MRLILFVSVLAVLACILVLVAVIAAGRRKDGSRPRDDHRN